MNGNIEKLNLNQREINKMIEALADSKKAGAMKSGADEGRLSVYTPVFDGAFDPERYVKSPVKILFIGKEPGFPGDGGWDYGGTPAKTGSSPAERRGSPPEKNHVYAFMNAVANGVLNNDFSTARVPDAGAPLYTTALINISNLPGEAHNGIDGNISRLYTDNREILEKKISAYAPDITVCYNTADTIWDSLQTQLAFDNYGTKYFTLEGKEIFPDQKNEPAEAPAAALYYCGNNKIIVDVYREAYRLKDDVSDKGWIAAALASFKPALTPPPVISSPVEETSGSKTGGAKKKKGSLLLPLIIALALILLLLAFLRFCKNPRETPPAPVPAAEAVKAPEPPPAPPVLPPAPVFSEITEVVFMKDSSAFLPSASSWLDGLAGELARHIARNPSASFRITGYTAVFPGLPDPAELSLERAGAIAKELSARGIAPGKLEAVGGGETDRWGNNSSEESRRPNRRIVIELK